MINKKINNPPNFWWRILIPIGVSIITGIIIFNIPLLKPFLGLGITIPFTITKSILDGWAIKINENKIKLMENNIKVNEQKVHSKYAISKIEHVRSVLHNSGIGIKPQSLTIGDLEVMLTDVWKCCIDDDKSKYQEFKGIVGDYKTALVKSIHDSSITPNISRFIDDLQKIETHLREKS